MIGRHKVICEDGDEYEVVLKKGEKVEVTKSGKLRFVGVLPSRVLRIEPVPENTDA